MRRIWILCLALMTALLAFLLLTTPAEEVALARERLTRAWHWILRCLGIGGVK